MGETQHRQAFTLAEILITLSIIGVVAALTIPSLIVKNQEKERVVAAKKIYNTLTNVYQLASLTYGPVESWGWTDGESAQGSISASEKIYPFFRIMKDCKINKGCWSDTTYFLNSSTAWGNLNGANDRAKALLNDGTSISLSTSSSTCIQNFGTSKSLQSICGWFTVDINGPKKPNQFGKDVFQFWIGKGGIAPWGAPQSTFRGIEGCINNDGQPCAGWIVFQENTDYIKNPVSWNE